MIKKILSLVFIFLSISQAQFKPPIGSSGGGCTTFGCLGGFADTTQLASAAALRAYEQLGGLAVKSLVTDTFSVTISYDSGSVKIDSNWVYGVGKSGTTLIGIMAQRDGGTSIVMNVTRDRGGSLVDCLTANYTVTTSYASAGTLQNTTSLINDTYHLAIRNVGGTAQHFVCVLIFSKTIQ